MPEYRITTCPLCDAPIEARGFPAGFTLPLKQRHGFCAEIGFSIGRWGHRDLNARAGKDRSVKFSEEICSDCYDKAQDLAKPLIDFLRQKDKSQPVGPKKPQDQRYSATFIHSKLIESAPGARRDGGGADV